MHTVYIYKLEVYILISMAPDLQLYKEDHNQDVCYFLILLQGKKRGRGLLESLACTKLICSMVTLI